MNIKAATSDSVNVITTIIIKIKNINNNKTHLCLTVTVGYVTLVFVSFPQLILTYFYTVVMLSFMCKTETFWLALSFGLLSLLVS